MEQASPQQPLTRQQVIKIYIGLMLGMLVASLSQTIVAPALPRIVAELGGIEHYSLIATGAMLASAVSVPVAGKLGDIYGRKPFFMGGLVIFMTGSVLSGVSLSFWWLVGARVIQGLGMGMIIPLAQAIIGDIIAPRERGKYQGIMGSVFGLSSIAAPLIGGYITDNLNWRWLFFVNLPLGFVALFVIFRFMNLPHQRRSRKIDYLGFITLGACLISALLATSWGGQEYPWNSWVIIGLYALSVVFGISFAFVEKHAAEPVIPFALWKNPLIVLSYVASLGLGAVMFGATFFIPIFAQGVLGVSVTNSGAIILPLMLGMIVTSTIVGLLISKTGHYKAFVLIGLVSVGLGYFLMTKMSVATSQIILIRNMIFTGVGIGASLQTFVLIVQNVSSAENMGVATSTTQLFRNIGGTTGIALMGSVMANRILVEIPRHLPAGAAKMLQGLDLGSGVGAILNPQTLSKLPPEMVLGIREGLAVVLAGVFKLGIPFVAIAFLATLFIKEVPLRRSLNTAGQEARTEKYGNCKAGTKSS